MSCSAAASSKGIEKFAARAPFECPVMPILSASTYGRSAMSSTASYMPVPPTASSAAGSGSELPWPYMSIDITT